MASFARSGPVWAGVLLLAVVAGLGCTPARPPLDRDPLHTGPQVRVRIFKSFGITHLSLDVRDKALVLQDPTGAPVPLPPDTPRVYLTQLGDQVAVAAQPGTAAAKQAPRFPEVWASQTDSRVVFFKLHIPELNIRRSYEGSRVEISVKHGRLALVNQLPLELYLARVLPSEMDPDHFTAEALKAQAVVARTWALKNIRFHQRFGYNFCDHTHCQVYTGRKLVSRRAEHAVRTTLGQVLVYERQLAEAFFFSTCGGNTVFLQDAWGGDGVPYLIRVSDRWQSGLRPYCSRSPYASWKVQSSLYRIQRKFQEAGTLSEREKLLDVKVEQVNRSNRVERVTLITDRGWHSVPVDAFRRALNRSEGRNRMFSRCFEVSVNHQEVQVSGRGLGHGVGLCQWGARGMAQHGFGYTDILLHYFVGTQVAGNYGRDAGRESKRQSVQR